MGTPTTHALYRRQLDAGFANLRFVPNLEQPYRDDHFRRIASVTRIGMLIGAGFYALYMGLIWLKTGAIYFDVPSLIRCSIIVALVIGAKLIPQLSARQHMPVVIAIYLYMALGITAIEVASHYSSLPTRYEGILLTIIHCCFFSGLLFRHCAVCICTVLLCYVSAGLYFSMPTDMLGYQSFFCLLAAWMGLTASYITEKTERENFLNRNLMNISANFDELTGLATRAAFDRYLPARLRQTASNDELPQALILVDIDHFKQLNDSRGHDTGDKCLKLVADILAGSLEQDAHAVARWGGDELIAVVDYENSCDLKHKADAIRENIENLHMANPASSHKVLTVSIGVVEIPTALRLAEKVLFRQADAALYQAKNQGRNQVVMHEAQAEEKVALEAETITA